MKYKIISDKLTIFSLGDEYFGRGVWLFSLSVLWDNLHTSSGYMFGSRMG
jgi:hypothetical protein